MLDLISELGQNGIRNIGRILGDEIDPDALRTDQFHDLFDLLQKFFRSRIEQQMRFIKEEDHLGLCKVPHLRHHFIQFGKHPEQKRRIHGRVQDQFLAVKNIDHSASVYIGLQPV